VWIFAWSHPSILALLSCGGRRLHGLFPLYLILHGIPDWLQWWRPILMFFIADKILSAAVI
jgi:hypothetical protein